MSKILPAATIVLVRDGAEGLETLLLRRSTALSFASGKWVFPGGRIDRADYLDAPDNVARAARTAAVREAREEANVVVREQSMVYFAHWTTPIDNPKRFATWFYIGEVQGDSSDVSVDNSEIVDYRWCTPQQAINDLHSGKISMMPPTFVTLTELSGCASAEQALAMYRQRPVPEILPRVIMTAQGILMLYPGDAGYESGDAAIGGPRNRFWMLDKAWRYEKTPDQV